MGGPLFERNARGVELTFLGSALYTEAKHLLGRFEGIVDRTKKAVDGEIGQLAVGVVEAAARDPLMARCIHLFNERYSDVELDFTRMDCEDQLRDIHAGRLDVGAMLYKPTEVAELDSIILRSVNIMLALSADHPLASYPDLRVGQIKDEPFIGVKQKGYNQVYLDMISHCITIGLEPRYVTQAATENMQFSLVREGVGVGLVLSSGTENLPKGVIIRPIADLDFSLSLALVWLKSSPSPTLRNFCRLARELTNKESNEVLPLARIIEQVR